MTVSAVTSGQLSLGQQITGPGVTANSFIVALGSGAGLTGTYTLSQSSTVGSATAMIAYPNTQGDAYCASGSAYSNIELDRGAPSSGSSYPWLTQFPSLAEAAYTFPPEVPGGNSIPSGLHIVIGGAANLLTSVNFEVCTSATSGALYSASPNPVAARALTLAQLQVAGAHYFIPVAQPLLEFVRFYMALTGTAPTIGTIMAWFGPITGGEQ
jgi:hypothetical protein